MEEFLNESLESSIDRKNKETKRKMERPRILKIQGSVRLA